MLKPCVQANICCSCVPHAGTGKVMSYGDIVKRQGSGGALAMAKQRDVMYEQYALQFVLPLHRMMSANDLYAQVDGVHGVGPLGRVYKCALRELEGAYGPPENGKAPSEVGLPPNAKPAKAWPPKTPKSGTKRKQPEDSSTADASAVSPAECAAMVEKICNASKQAHPAGEPWMNINIWMNGAFSM